MRVLGAAALAGAGLAAYSVWEPYRFRLAEHHLEMPPESPRLSILHVSDTHMTGRTRALEAWMESLPERLPAVPDLVVATGDFIDNDEGIGRAVSALTKLEARLGRFYVLGSHDYYISQFQGYSKYLGFSGSPIRPKLADVAALEDGLRDKGWVALTNTTHLLDGPWGRIRLAGVDDPYIGRHKLSHIERGPDEVLAIGLVHSPDVVSEWFQAGFDLVVAGHTHGGQVRVPYFGALVTNCSLPTALAMGPHRVGSGWLHVSPGLGNGRHSGIRFACRPEATLLHLNPTDGSTQN